MTRFRSIAIVAGLAPLIVGAFSSASRAQIFAAPPVAAPYPGFGYGYGVPSVFGYGYGYRHPPIGAIYARPAVQGSLAYQALATGRALPRNYAGAAVYNPYFASGLSPLAVQSALGELGLPGAYRPSASRLAPVPPGVGAGPVDPDGY